ncbi:MAG TPA: S1/P1 nuclease [Pyrinomonadaceae bacterium]|nr:S1/P1 nuclease [Pyrinomonadaceae bacterium]
MRQETDSTTKARLAVDEEDRVRQIVHLEEPWMSQEPNPLLAAVDYLRRMDLLQVTTSELRSPLEKVSFTEPREQGIEYRLGGVKTLFDTSTIIFNQTFLNVPVWRAAITLTIKHNPNRIISATDTTERYVSAVLPSAQKIEEHRTIFALAEADRQLRVLGLHDRASTVGLAENDEQPRTAAFIRRVLGRDAALVFGEDASADDARAIRGRFFVYRYDAANRVPTVALQHRETLDESSTETPDAPAPEPPGRPILELPPVDQSIENGDWRVVSEVTFALTTPEYGQLNWRALLDVETDSVLLLEPLVAGLNGLVFLRDPITKGTATATAATSNSVLNPFRDVVELPNLDAPANGMQSLRGRFAAVVERHPPVIAAPTKPVGEEFNFDVRTNDFAAVNAYYHVDRFFALVESLGFPSQQYFDGTNFPIDVDHRSGNEINAHCGSNGSGGIGHACYELNDTTNTTNPVGRACDSRVHFHEVGGHGTLFDHVGSGLFGFAHSAGDSMAAIFHDPDSRAVERFRYAPWNPTNLRRFDRKVEEGWAWAGTFDRGNADYGSEQILATTLFRFYQSIGGDSPDINRRRFASRMSMFLILSAIHTLTPATNPNSALGFVNALRTADTFNWSTEGIFGGAYGKVLRWTFEKQGLFQAPGTPTPVTRPGQPPEVDVYIDDGRGGEYQFQADHTQNPSIWNRRAADGETTNQEPVAGMTNFAYVRVKNRGTTQAQNVKVRGYHLRPGGGAIWPTDFQPLTTPDLAAGTLAPNNQQEKIVGPFAWVPAVTMFGRDSLLMVASATGDPSNTDSFMTNQSIPDWRLVPNDNNIGMRTLVPIAGESAPPQNPALETLTAGTVALGAQPSAGTVTGGSASERMLSELFSSGQGFKKVRIKSVTFQVDLDDEVSVEPARLPDKLARTVDSSGRVPVAAENEDSWGIRRHGLIGTVAWERMNSERARNEILRIFEEADAESSLGECARWADRIKFDPPSDAATIKFLSEETRFSTWHYVNLPLGLDGYNRELHPEFTRRNDIVQTILRCIESLRTPGQNARFPEIIALRWLTHLLGDLHQPVHIGCGYIANARTNQARLVFDPQTAVGLGSDRGGGALLLPDVNDNLHGYWDSRLGPNFISESLDPSLDEELLNELRRTPVSSANAEDGDIPSRVIGWANETLRAAREYAYPDSLRIVSYNPSPSGEELYRVEWEGEASYRQRCEHVVSERMAAAANNLASLLDSIWP